MNFSHLSRHPRWLFATLICVLIAYREILLWNVSSHNLPNYAGWFFNLSDTSPQFLYLLAVGLVYVRRSDIARALAGRPAPLSALLFTVPAVALYVWGRYTAASDVVYLSFLTALLAGVLLVSGWHLAGRLAVPFLILLLAVPVPAVLINEMVFPFQLWTAEHSVRLLEVFGIPAYREGERIALLGGHWVRVAESCTALGFMKWLLIIALAYVYVFPVSRLHAWILVLSAPLIAYAVNLLRAFSLILSPEKDVLSIHLAQGIVFFMIGFALLYALDSLLLRLCPRCDDHVSNSIQGTASPGVSGRSQRVLFALVALLAVLSFTVPRWTGDLQAAGYSPRLPDRLGDWRLGGPLKENRLFLGGVRYDGTLSRYYQRGDEQVAVFIGVDDRRHRDRSLVSEKNTFQSEMGLLEENFPVKLEGVDGAVTATIATTSRYGRLLSYTWYEGVAGPGEEALRALLALDQSPLRRPGSAMVFRLSTDAAATDEGMATADKRLRDFLHAIQHPDS